VSVERPNLLKIFVKKAIDAKNIKNFFVRCSYYDNFAP
jgi:hypothetical protein